MKDEYNAEETLAEYGYSNKKKGKGLAGFVIAFLLLLTIGAGVSAFYFMKMWSEEQGKSLTFDRQIKDLNEKVSLLETTNADLSSRLADMQATNERIQDEWATQVATMRDQHKEQLRRTYGQMNEIVYDSRKTLEYIGEIEGRLRDGQNLATEDAAKLSNVINGIAFLYEQYKKPMTEFRELDRYFAQQLASIPESSKVNPKESTPVLRRLFKNKEFKEQQATFYQDQGKRQALLKAQAEVKAAYSRAQAQMRALDLDKNRYLLQLDKIVEANEVAAADVQSFFDQSKEILKIHDKIMKIQPPKMPAVKP